MADAEIRRLLETDVCATFECGEADVDGFVRNYVHINEFKYRACATYVAVVAGSIVSIATVVPASIDPRVLGRERKGLAGYPQPVLKLAKFGTDRTFSGKGYGMQLMHRVFVCAHVLVREYGCIGVATDAVLGAVSYYQRFGFTKLSEPTTPECGTLMYLPRRKIPGG